MDRLVKDYHDAGPTQEWLERMALFILHSPDLNELALSWFGHYLDTINCAVMGLTETWPPILVAARFLEQKCPTLNRAVIAISE